MKIINWNIQNRTAADWPSRREALAAVLGEWRAHLLCVQEAYLDQVEFIASVLPGWGRTGVGRDDGAGEGEHCAIYFDREHFELLAGETFWLSDTPDRPGSAWGCEFNRICTWARLRQAGGGEMTVFNTHFPLVAQARERSARLVVRRMAELAGGKPALLMGDFNCTPGSVPWSTLTGSRLVSAATGDQATFRQVGREQTCIDAIFVSPDWGISDFRLITDAPGGVSPSDHLGLWAEVSL